MNERVVLGCQRPGEGLFIHALDRQLARRHLTLPAFEHALADELHGGKAPALGELPVRMLGVREAPVNRRPVGSAGLDR